jgi:ATP-dependent protease ClpP protease subunit
MPNLSAILNETMAVGSGQDVVRRKYIKNLSEVTGRNVIVYYSGWLQKGAIKELQHLFAVNDNDKNGFMATIHQLDRSEGLDLILHTPGGDGPAAESIVHYLRQMFGTNIRAFVPQLAMSAGTMIALSCKEIFMGKHSNLGPIDPQIGGFPANGVIDEFNRAQADIASATSPQEQFARVATWQPIIAKYTPTLIGECVNAITWAANIVTEWLVTGMFEGDEHAVQKAERIVADLSSHEETKTHARHIHVEQLRDLGVKVTPLEADQDLQDAVLTVHHACINSFQQTPAVKIIENQNAVSFIVQAIVQQFPFPMPVQQNPPRAAENPMQPVFPAEPVAPAVPVPPTEPA